jgi:putative ABC transport system permease protein
VGLACLSGWAARNTELSFRLPWQLMLVSFLAIIVICILSSLLSIWKVIQLEPAIVFKQ